jgi:hypothetical protein
MLCSVGVITVTIVIVAYISHQGQRGPISVPISPSPIRLIEVSAFLTVLTQVQHLSQSEQFSLLSSEAEKGEPFVVRGLRDVGEWKAIKDWSVESFVEKVLAS